jgi:hypothetical protein
MPVKYRWNSLLADYNTCGIPDHASIIPKEFIESILKE